MDLLEQAALVEDLEVAADGHVGDAELAHEVGDADRAVLADPVEDERLALTREHQATLRMIDATGFDTRRPPPSDPTDCRPTRQKVNVFHTDCRT